MQPISVLFLFLMMLSSLVSILFLLAIVYLYVRWIYENRENIHYYLAPVAILFTCLLVAGIYQGHVFERAEIASYSTGEGWISEVKYQEPNYTGEDIPIEIVILGPFVGLVLMLIALPRGMRKTQGIHFAMLLVFVYPVLAIITLSQVGGSRPRFYSGNSLPAVGTRMPKNLHP